MKSDDEYDDFEENLLFQMLDMVVDELESDVGGRGQVGGSRVERQYIYCNREAFHAWLYNNYFVDYPTYWPVKF